MMNAMSLQHMTGLPAKRKTRRGGRGKGNKAVAPTGLAIAQRHHSALNAAMAGGNLRAAKTHAFNLGNALHVATGGSLSKAGQPSGSSMTGDMTSGVDPDLMNDANGPDAEAISDLNATDSPTAAAPSMGLGAVAKKPEPPKAAMLFGAMKKMAKNRVNKIGGY